MPKQLILKCEKYSLFILCLLALILRLWGVKQDLPYTYYGDENYLIYHSLKFGTGDLNPHWFVWPTFFQYLLFFLFVIFYFIGFVVGWFKNTADFLYLYCSDPTIFFLIGRITAALLGTVSIYLVYSLAKNAYDKTTGLISAVLFAFMPLSIEYCHYAVVDTPLVFMILLSFIFILNILVYGRLKDYLLGGFFTGLAIATKYSAGLLILPIILVHLFASKKRGSLKAILGHQFILCLAFVFLGFFLSCPFAILDFPKFSSDIRDEILCAKIGWFGWERTNPHLIHLSHLKDGLSIPLLIISFFGLIFAIIKREKADLIFLAFVITYYLIISKGVNPYSRFMLPLLPFLVIFAGRLLADLKNWAINKKIGFLFFVLLLFLLAGPLYRSIKIDFYFTLPNTATLAKEWVEKNIPPASKILLNEYGPPLTQSPEGIRLKSSLKSKEALQYGYHKKRNLFYEIKEEVARKKISYELSYIPYPI